MLILGLMELLLVPAFVIATSYIVKLFGKRLQKGIKRRVKDKSEQLKEVRKERKFLEKQVRKEKDAEVQVALGVDLMSEFKKEVTMTIEVVTLKALHTFMIVVTWVSRFVTWVVALVTGSMVVATLGLSLAVLSVVIMMTSSSLSTTGNKADKPKTEQTSSTNSEVTAVGRVPETVEERAKLVAKLVREYEPNATKNGTIGMLANFWHESHITAKRAEADYVNPPVGASDTAWDDEAWVTMGEPELYGGRFPNIKRRGLGLGQFTDTYDGAIRNTLLREFAKKHNKKWYDLDLQIKFMFEGDDPYYQKILRDILTSNEDSATLTARFLAEWEGVPGNAIEKRLSHAKELETLLADEFDK